MKSFKSLRDVSHSCAVPGDEKWIYLIPALSSIDRNSPIVAVNSFRLGLCQRSQAIQSNLRLEIGSP
jgi:hypothetical protein